MDKDRILKEAGFVLLPPPPYVNKQIDQELVFMPTSDRRYQHRCQAQDGTNLFAYAWFDSAGAMLTTKQNIGSQRDIVSELESVDGGKLAQAVDEFFDQHGGKGKSYW